MRAKRNNTRRVKHIFFVLFTIVLLSSVQLRAQDAEALAALVGVLKESDDEGFQLDILKGISAALKGQRNLKSPEGWDTEAARLGGELECGGAAVGAGAFVDVREQGCAARFTEGFGGWQG